MFGFFDCGRHGLRSARRGCSARTPTACSTGPEQTHTSPTATFLNATVFLPLTTRRVVCAGFLFRQGQPPVAILVRGRVRTDPQSSPSLALFECNGDLLTGVGFAPNNDVGPLLKDHVVREDGVRLDIGPCRGG